MTTLTDKEMIKEIKERIGSPTSETILSAGLMKLLWHHWKQKRQICLGGFTIEEAKELHENLVKSHVSKALSGEK